MVVVMPVEIGEDGGKNLQLLMMEHFKGVGWEVKPGVKVITK